MVGGQDRALPTTRVAHATVSVAFTESPQLAAAQDAGIPTLLKWALRREIWRSGRGWQTVRMRSRRRALWSATVGGGPCLACGLEGQVVAAPNRWARLKGWLLDGQGPSPTLRCPNGHEWPAASSSSLMVMADRGLSWWRWPARMMRVLMQHRTAEPVPMFWLGATAVGVVLGVVLRVTLGWAWLPVTVVWLLLVWLVFLATALLRPGRDNLWIDLVRTASPTRAERLETKQLIRLVQAAPGPAYGLANWTRQRSLGGRGQSGSLLTHLELMYGHPPDEPHLRVDTIWKWPDRPDLERDHIRRELSRELRHCETPPPKDLAPDDLDQWSIARRIDIGRRPIPEWVRSAFLIDDVWHPAETFTAGDNWVAMINTDSALVALQSHGIPPHRVSLTQVPDIRSYVRDSTHLRDRSVQRRR